MFIDLSTVLKRGDAVDLFVRKVFSAGRVSGHYLSGISHVYFASHVVQEIAVTQEIIVFYWIWFGCVPYFLLYKSPNLSVLRVYALGEPVGVRKQPAFRCREASAGSPPLVGCDGVIHLVCNDPISPSVNIEKRVRDIANGHSLVARINMCPLIIHAVEFPVIQMRVHLKQFRVSVNTVEWCVGHRRPRFIPDVRG